MTVSITNVFIVTSLRRILCRHVGRYGTFLATSACWLDSESQYQGQIGVVKILHEFADHAFHLELILLESFVMTLQ